MNIRLLAVLFAFCSVAFSGGVLAAPGEGKGKDPAGSANAQMQQKKARAEEQVRSEAQVRSEQEKRSEEKMRAEEKTRSMERVHADDQGSSQSAEMRNRNEERKEIKEEYRTAVKSAEQERQTGKKPWWKFWGSEEEG